MISFSSFSVANLWLREEGQEFRWPCSLEEDEWNFAMEIINDFYSKIKFPNEALILK